jgi:hypothetical protein
MLYKSICTKEVMDKWTVFCFTVLFLQSSMYKLGSTLNLLAFQYGNVPWYRWEYERSLTGTQTQETLERALARSFARLENCNESIIFSRVA